MARPWPLVYGLPVAWIVLVFSAPHIFTPVEWGLFGELGLLIIPLVASTGASALFVGLRSPCPWQREMIALAGIVGMGVFLGLAVWAVGFGGWSHVTQAAIYLAGVTLAVGVTIALGWPGLFIARGFRSAMRRGEPSDPPARPEGPT